MADNKSEAQKPLEEDDAPAPGDALTPADMGGDNRSNFVQPGKSPERIKSPAFPKTKE